MGNTCIRSTKVSSNTILDYLTSWPGTVLQWSDEDLSEFASCFRVHKVRAGKEISFNDSQFFFIVAEGSVEIQTVIPCYRLKTNKRQYLCKKDKGDMVFAPSMRKLILHSIAKDAYEIKDEKVRNKNVSDLKARKSLLESVKKFTIKSLTGSTILQLDWTQFDMNFVQETRPLNSKIDITMLKAMMQSNLVDYLEKLPITSDLPISKLETVARMCQYSVQKEGSVLCKEGDVGSYVYVLLSGEVKVEASIHAMIVEYLDETPYSCEKENKSVRFEDEVDIEVEKTEGASPSQKKYNHRRKSLSDAGKNYNRKLVKAASVSSEEENNDDSASFQKVELARLGPGDYFGEMSTFLDIPRTATVTATTNVLMISLSKENFKSLYLAIAPHLEHDFEKMIKLHILQNLFQLKSPFLDEMTTSKINAMAEKTKITEVKANRFVFKEGDEASSFYFQCTGSSLVKKNIDGQMRVLRRINAGDYFGELALLNDSKRSATVIAKSYSVLLEISRDDFNECFEDSPEIISEFIVRMKGKDVDLKSLLDFSKSKEVFRTYLEEANTIHNLDFYEDVTGYLNGFGSLTHEQNQKKARGIIEQYLTEGSERAVIVSNETNTEVQELLASDVFEKDSFEQPLREVFESMESGVFQKFRESVSFIQLMDRLRSYDDIDVKLIS